MRVAHLNVTDQRGGAGIAARRLHQAMLDQGIDSWMLVQEKATTDSRVISPSSFSFSAARRATIDRLPLRSRYGEVRTAWHTGWLPNPGLFRRIRDVAPDIIVLHWVGAGMLPHAALENLPCPFVWVLHDMAPFTGGCHYDKGCGRYSVGCGSCPILGSTDPNDLSRRIFLQKSKALASARFSIVAISRWMEELARKSILFANSDIRTIHHPLDLDIYRPRDRVVIRQRLGWTTRRRVLLFSAVNALQDRRKGFHHLNDALEQLRCSGMKMDDIHIRVLGTKEGPGKHGGASTFYEKGALSQEDVADRYAAADIVVTPSEQEAFGLVAAEAQACGTPVVAFNHGGLKDIVEHMQTGYLAVPGDGRDLAAGLRLLLESEPFREEAGMRARHRALQMYQPARQAQAYVGLFQSLLDQETPAPVEELVKNGGSL